MKAFLRLLPCVLVALSLIVAPAMAASGDPGPKAEKAEKKGQKKDLKDKKDKKGKKKKGDDGAQTDLDS